MPLLLDFLSGAFTFILEDEKMKPYQTTLKLLTVLILVLLVLPASPARTVQAAAEYSSSFPPPTNACAGSGYMRSLSLTQALPRGDDNSGGPFALGFTINYYGTSYSDVYINTNGDLTFGSSSNRFYTRNGMTDLSLPAIAPFLADADTRAVGSPNLIYYDQVTVDGHPAFAVHWEQVGYYNQHIDKTNDFMVILINRADRAAGDFDIEFNYNQIQWGAYGTIGLADGFAGLDDYQAPGSLAYSYFFDSNLTTGAVHTALNSPNCGQWVFPVAVGLPVVARWMVYSMDNLGCNGNDIRFTTVLINVTFPTTLRFRTLVDAGGIRYQDEDDGVPSSGNAPYYWNLRYSDTGGPATGVWPLPNDTPIAVQFQLIDGVGGPAVVISEVHLTKCNGGALMDDFKDVPAGYWADSWIYRLAAAGITNGCGLTPLIYCPDDYVSRAQMAIFLERGMHGAAYTPPAGTGTVFADVPLSYWAVNWIEKFYADGITSGCGTGPLTYCPDDSVTRAQMAIFLLRSEHGALYTPPAAVGIFDDVPTTYWAANWIEQLHAEGITTGCGISPLVYCPDYSVTRAEMAIFLVRTFGLP